MSYQGDLSNLLEDGLREHRPIAPVTDHRQSDGFDDEDFAEDRIEEVVYNDPEPHVRDNGDGIDPIGDLDEFE